jgi:hypothetical protein
VQRVDALVEDENRRALAASRAASANCTAIVDLPVPGAPTKSVLVPVSMPPPSR